MMNPEPPPEAEPIKFDKNTKPSFDVHEKPVEKAPVAGDAAAVKTDAKPVVATPTPVVKPVVKPAAATPKAALEAKPKTKSEVKPAVNSKPAAPAAIPSQPTKAVQ